MRILFQRFSRQETQAFAIITRMFRAIGIVIILWYVSQLFSQSFIAMDSAGKATFEAVEAAAILSKGRID